MYVSVQSLYVYIQYKHVGIWYCMFDWPDLDVWLCFYSLFFVHRSHPPKSRTPRRTQVAKTWITRHSGARIGWRENIWGKNPINDGVPSGKRLHNYGKSLCLMGKSTISSWAMFNSYVTNYQRVKTMVFRVHKFLSNNPLSFSSVWILMANGCSRTSSLNSHFQRSNQPKYYILYVLDARVGMFIGG